MDSVLRGWVIGHLLGEAISRRRDAQQRWCAIAYSDLTGMAWAWNHRSASAAERHRAQIREELGFREATRDDEESLIEWLAAEICPVVLNDEGVRAALLARCRKLGIEPPGRLERIVGGARSRFDKGFCAEVVERLAAESIDRLEELVTGRNGFLVELKSDPGPLGLDTLLEEIVKLGRAKAIGLPADLLSGWRPTASVDT